MQSGGAKGEKWRIDWDTLPGGGKWENPLMGWASSADYMQGTRLTFTSMEDAVRFAEKQGWDYYVQQPTVKVSTIISKLRVVIDGMNAENTTEELRRELCLQAA